MLRIIFEATTDKQTPVNMVQHSYFNLAGHAAGRALDQVLYINGLAADTCAACLRAPASADAITLISILGAHEGKVT